MIPPPHSDPGRRNAQKDKKDAPARRAASKNRFEWNGRGGGGFNASRCFPATLRRLKEREREGERERERERGRGRGREAAMAPKRFLSTHSSLPPSRACGGLSLIISRDGKMQLSLSPSVVSPSSSSLPATDAHHAPAAPVPARPPPRRH